MSTPFYDLASLVVLPSGYRSGKVYAQKPLTTDGQLTFTRASDATRVASNGLIEKVRTNSALQSQTFENASWTKHAGATITANTTTAPDGTLTAETLNVATTIFSGLYQVFTTSTNSWTTSLFVKKGTKNFIYLFDPSTNRYAWFNLTTGAVGQKTASTEAAMISVGNGWYRISVTTAVAGNAGHFIQFGLSDADGSFTPATTGTAFIWGAQAEVSDFGATDYIPTTTAGVSVGPVSGLPRLDYLNSTCPKLLLESQRTNGHTFSENFDNAGWSKLSSTISANSAISPDGYQNADKLVDNSTSGTHVAFQAYSFASAVSHTISVFAKAAEITSINIFNNVAAGFDATFNLSNGTVTSVASGGTATITAYGNGWYRCAVTATASITSANTQFRLVKSGNTSYVGNGTDGLLLWGAQLEVGAYATSYIPTLGAAVTRLKDDCVKTGVSALIGQTEGTVFVEFKMNGQSQSEDIYSNDKNLTGSISIQTTVSGQLGGFVCYAGTFISFSTSVGAIQIGQTYKCALAYKTGNSAFYLNGIQVGTSSTAFAFTTTLQEIDIANSAVYFAHLNNKSISQVLQFKTRLTNAQLAELTAL